MIHSAFGPPQFADDINRINSRAASDTTGPNRWSPANEERFFEDVFRNFTFGFEGLIKALTGPGSDEIHIPPPPTTTAAGEIPSADTNPFFRDLWEQMFRKDRITMFAYRGTY